MYATNSDLTRCLSLEITKYNKIILNLEIANASMGKQAMEKKKQVEPLLGTLSQYRRQGSPNSERKRSNKTILVHYFYVKYLIYLKE